MDFKEYNEVITVSVITGCLITFIHLLHIYMLY